MKRLAWVLVLAVVVSGCASNSGIVPIGKDIYMVSRQAATGFSGSGSLKVKAIQEAVQYCGKQGKKIQVVSTYEARPPYIFTNFPKAEVQFMCLDISDLQFQRTHLEKSPDVVIKRDDSISADINIKTKNENKKDFDIYTELMKLNDLKEKGILSEGEFDEQKKKILGER